MSDVLVRIKRAVLAGRYKFSQKAQVEVDADGLTEFDVAEAILNAVAFTRKSVPGARFGRRPESISMSFKARTWMDYLSTPKESLFAKLAWRPITFSSLPSELFIRNRPGADAGHER